MMFDGGVSTVSRASAIKWFLQDFGYNYLSHYDLSDVSEPLLKAELEAQWTQFKEKAGEWEAYCRAGCRLCGAACGIRGA